jgi:alpha/beta superfamily hydrolase
MVTVAVPDEGLVLEAVWQRGGERSAVIAPPHPVYGGSLDNPVVNELAYGLFRAGWSSLRFNWRGVGASQGQVTDDPGAAERDYRAALEHTSATVPGPVLAGGYSFGAATALRVALTERRVGSLVLVAPPVAMLSGIELEKIQVPVYAISGASDAFSPLGALGDELSRLPDHHLDVIPGADHVFATGGLAELTELARDAGQRIAGV